MTGYAKRWGPLFEQRTDFCEMELAAIIERATLNINSRTLKNLHIPRSVARHPPGPDLCCVSNFFVDKELPAWKACGSIPPASSEIDIAVANTMDDEHLRFTPDGHDS